MFAKRSVPFVSQRQKLCVEPGRLAKVASAYYEQTMWRCGQDSEYAQTVVLPNSLYPATLIADYETRPQHRLRWAC